MSSSSQKISAVRMAKKAGRNYFFHLACSPAQMSRVKNDFVTGSLKFCIRLQKTPVRRSYHYFYSLCLCQVKRTQFNTKDELTSQKAINVNDFMPLSSLISTRINILLKYHGSVAKYQTQFVRVKFTFCMCIYFHITIIYFIKF